MDDAPFGSVAHALRWAYAVAGSAVIEMSTINRWMGEKYPSPGRGFQADALSPFERHGQAAVVMRAVEQLDDPVLRAYVCVNWWWSPRNARISDRRGDGSEARRAEFELAAMDFMVHHLAAALGTGMFRRRSLVLIIRKWRGDNPGLRALQAEMRCRTEDIGRRMAPATERLNAMHNEVLEKLDVSLQHVVRHYISEAV